MLVFFLKQKDVQEICKQLILAVFLQQLLCLKDWVHHALTPLAKEKLRGKETTMVSHVGQEKNELEQR